MHFLGVYYTLMKIVVFSNYVYGGNISMILITSPQEFVLIDTLYYIHITMTP